jgi:membrane associated rhomboid family serine protease
MTLAGLIIGVGTVALLTPILNVLGASGETWGLAERFLIISSPSLPCSRPGCAAPRCYAVSVMLGGQ